MSCLVVAAMIHLAMSSPNIIIIYIKRCLNLLHLLAEFNKKNKKILCRKSIRRPNIGKNVIRNGYLILLLIPFHPITFHCQLCDFYKQAQLSYSMKRSDDSKELFSHQNCYSVYIFKYSVIVINSIGLGFG